MDGALAVKMIVTLILSEDVKWGTVWLFGTIGDGLWLPEFGAGRRE